MFKNWQNLTSGIVQKITKCRLNKSHFHFRGEGAKRNGAKAKEKGEDPTEDLQRQNAAAAATGGAAGAANNAHPRHGRRRAGPSPTHVSAGSAPTPTSAQTIRGRRVYASTVSRALSTASQSTVEFRHKVFPKYEIPEPPGATPRIPRRFFAGSGAAPLWSRRGRLASSEVRLTGSGQRRVVELELIRTRVGSWYRLIELE